MTMWVINFKYGWLILDLWIRSRTAAVGTFQIQDGTNGSSLDETDLLRL